MDRNRALGAVVPVARSDVYLTAVAERRIVRHSAALPHDSAGKRGCRVDCKANPGHAS